MYESFFGLQKRPFAPVPSSGQFFPAATIENARQTLGRCIQRAEGPAMVVGPSGMGKTLLCQVLAEQFRNQLEVVLLDSGRMGTRRALFQAILYGLSRPYRGMDEGELRIALADYLTSPKCSPGGLLLLVDEAHTLSLRLLDEIRMLTNLVWAGQARTRLVLAGGPGLEERLASPKLASFSQRLAARCYLESFNRTETENYIRDQIAKAGGDGPRLFPSETCCAVHQATDGVPRLVNQVCDHALLLCYTAGRRSVERVAIEESWSDLQQLPTPWNAQPNCAQPAAGVVEFGELNDDPPPAAEPAAPAAEAQLDHIEQMVGELEDDFQPAGSIGPEVELRFDNPGNPFSEPFAEEEVVAPLRAGRSSGGQPSGAPAPNPSRVAPAADDILDGTQPSRELAATESATGDPGSCDTVPLRPLTAEEPGGADDPDVIIEDDAPDVQYQCHRPVTTVRRHEYRQLFSRLRQK